MGFLIRSAFWFSLVLLVLPLSPGGGTQGGETVGAIEAFGAAREALGDLSDFCDRKPDVCETGRAAFHTIGVRAREGARIAYELLDDQLAEPDQSIKTGGVAIQQAAVE